METLTPEQRNDAVSYLGTDRRGLIFLKEKLNGIIVLGKFTLEAEDVQSSPDFTRADAIEFFKKLEEFGVGDYVQGRRGHSTRFIFEIPLRELRLILASAEVFSPTKNIANGIEVKVHKFLLRPEFETEISLPTDFKHKDCERLKNWLDTLPFD